MELFLIALLAMIALAILAALTKKQSKDSNLSYDNRCVLFTQAERCFLGVLEQALDNRRYRVLGKVRLEDIVKPAKGLSRSTRTTALNKINQKHVDFVICTTDDLSLVAAIELDDKSHEQNDRAERDLFVDRVLQDARIPIAHFSAKRAYAIHEVRAKLVELGLKETSTTAHATAKEAPSAEPLETVTAKEPLAPPPKAKPAANVASPPRPNEKRPVDEPPAPSRRKSPHMPEMLSADGKAESSKRPPCR